MPVTPDRMFEEFSDALSRLAPQSHQHIGVAVSGGGDSMALLDLAQRWAAGSQRRISAMTVDHGLRDSSDEIALVSAYCKKNDINHQISEWTGWNKVGNLQSAARTARRSLIDEWVKDRNIDILLLGHTADDQAETVLMRLARGSGVDGLAGMRAQSGHVMRPLLGISRADLRAYLKSRDIQWADDPSNDDLRFDRIKARKMMAQLATLGLSTDRLLQTAAHMQKAQRSLGEHALDFAQTHVRADAGDLIMTSQALDVTASDTQARVMSQAIRWLGQHDYRPRYDALCDAAFAVRSGDVRTLGGVVMTPFEGGARLSRELNAIKDIVICDGTEAIQIWDGRWWLRPAAEKGATSQTPKRFEKGMIIKALGDDIMLITDWRSIGLPRQSIMTSPSLWRGTELIAAPVAGLANGWSAQIVADFPRSLLMH